MESANIRRWQPDDDVESLTGLIHRAYRPNAELGFHFVATHQSPEITAERLDSGISFVAEQNGQIVGTITLEFPIEIPHGEYVTDRPLALFGQFAVEPGLQGGGVGFELLRRAEEEARRLGAAEICLDTAQGAKHLISYYERQGYQIRAEADWRPSVNYKSWVMVKEL
ncbi:MAG TPA: GNAT family N-acetyltransferase [Fimbriimonadaceae bacterium]|nr:GNAT family N-acetyltransferase [Fimbriimonadaceae bacterium]